MSFTARARARLLAGAVLAALVLAALTVLVATDLVWLDRTDLDVGGGAQAWTATHAWGAHFWVAVERVFGTVPMLVYTMVAAALLAIRRHVRAAVWTLAVMLGTALSTWGMKLLLSRARPEWTDPVHSVNGFAFPSGHSSHIASGAGVAVVLAAVLVRRRGLRRTVDAVALVLTLLVGADRIFLGVHHVSDVLAGYALGGLWVLAAAWLVDPAPRARPRPAFASPVPETRQLAAVLNPSKFTDGADLAAFRAMVERTAAATGWGPPAWYETTVADPGRAMAEQAAISGAELVLVCGGDGTVRTVCAELAGTGVAVGVVPAGTGNLLARNLGIPLFLQAAVETALNGQDRAVDLVAISGDGIDDDAHFLVMAGMGFDAAIMEGANEQTKARVGWLAYVVSALRNLMFPAVRLEVSLDGGPWTRHRARTVVVGNVGYLQAGMPLIPDAAIDDGQLDVVLLNPRRFVSWIPLAVRVLSKRRRTDETINRMTGRRVSVRSSTDTPRQLDGDPIGPGRELHCECLHGRLLVRVPR